MRNLDLDSANAAERRRPRGPVLELIAALLEKGADVERARQGVPARAAVHDAARVAGVGGLHGTDGVPSAALSADVPLMRLLLRSGADPNITTFNGTTALMAAAGVNWVIRQTYSESPETWLEAVKLCLELGADVNAVNAMGLAAVHGAANRGSDDIIELLARQGATRRQGQGRTHADRLGRRCVPRDELAGREAVDDGADPQAAGGDIDAGIEEAR